MKFQQTIWKNQQTKNQQTIWMFEWMDEFTHPWSPCWLYERTQLVRTLVCKNDVLVYSCCLVLHFVPISCAQQLLSQYSRHRCTVVDCCSAYKEPRLNSIICKVYKVIQPQITDMPICTHLGLILCKDLCILVKMCMRERKEIQTRPVQFLSGT